MHFQKTNSCHLVLGHRTLQEESRAVDLGVTIMNDLRWNAHILTKPVNATKSFNFSRHSVPHQVLSRVKFNLSQSCVFSIIINCCSSWFANISLTHKMESLNHKCLKWCLGNNSYSVLLLTSATMPIAYQNKERDLRLFAGISSGATCMNVRVQFTVQCDNRSLRSNAKPKLVALIFEKNGSSVVFSRATQLHDSTKTDLIILSRNFKDQL